MDKKKHKFYWEEHDNPDKAIRSRPTIWNIPSLLQKKPMGFTFSFQFPRIQSSKSDISIKDTGDSVVAVAMFPGFEKDHIKIDIRKNYINIVAAKKKSSKGDENGVAFSVSSTESVVRSASLPSEVDFEKAKQNFSNGILTITMPKIKKKFRIFGR